MTLFFDSFNDYVASLVCHQLEENSLPHSTYEEDNYFVQIIHQFVQIDLSLLFTNKDSYVLINPSDPGFCSNNYHPIDHFPTSISHENCFASSDPYVLSSHFSDTFQVVEVLQPLLIRPSLSSQDLWTWSDLFSLTRLPS